MTSTNGTAVVTGASRGIGRAVARRLSDDGWAVACAATTEANSGPVVDEIRAAGGEALPVAMAVQDRAAVDAGLDRAEAELGPLTLMVNNAGIAGVTPFVDTDPDEFAQIVDINLVGVFHGSQSAARRMLAAGTRGGIIQLGSIAGITPFPKRLAYCASKAAVHQMTQVMALELAEHGIRVNCVAPGYIRTDMVQGLIDDGRLPEAPLVNRIPMNDLGTVDDIANAVAFLASDQAAYVTGETMVVDGGWVSNGHI